mmetsp:Transcript_25251/g.41093  ORF Transcript_25251/g.41093 Transcript_25251/m.41093 type:complete len:224 (-) Transcript_25251:395-1066(-)
MTVVLGGAAVHFIRPHDQIVDIHRQRVDNVRFILCRHYRQLCSRHHIRHRLLVQWLITRALSTVQYNVWSPIQIILAILCMRIRRLVVRRQLQRPTITPRCFMRRIKKRSALATVTCATSTIGIIADITHHIGLHLTAQIFIRRASINIQHDGTKISIGHVIASIIAKYSACFTRLTITGDSEFRMQVGRCKPIAPAITIATISAINDFVRIAVLIHRREIRC